MIEINVHGISEFSTEEKQQVDKFQIQAMNLEENLDLQSLVALWSEKEKVAKANPSIPQFWQTILKCRLIQVRVLLF